jgi:Tfp pilus assembly protein PilF
VLKRRGDLLVGFGSAIQLWMPNMAPPAARASPGVRSEWAMPRPAVIRFIFARHDLERVALAVAVHDPAVEQIGDGGEADVRVRAHVDALARHELHRAHLVEEDEGADHLALAVRQGAAHLEPPRSRARGTITRSSASQERLSPSTGSWSGIQLMDWQNRATDMLPTRWIAALAFLSGVFAPAAFAAPASEQPPRAERPAGEDDARLLWQQGYLLHELGLYDAAIERFRASIAVQPSAEAHTFLGWSLSHLGELEDAIAECKTAIGIDPEFGNPYNDIGVYLMELGRAEEAIAWFDRAIEAGRYCCYQFPHFNKGRVLLEQGDTAAATRSFESALEHDPGYLPAREMLRLLKEKLGHPL